jgi:uncharacterized protein YdeI (YjbR/CyaY-like superfamily)
VKPENIRFFKSAGEFRRWLEKNHDTAPFQWVGFWKKDSGKTGMSYDEAVLESLCFGWIDGQTNRVDDDAVTTRFSPRRAGSNWSAVNTAKVEALTKAGRMQQSGMAAFRARREPQPGEYTYETRPADLPEEYAGLFRKHANAWTFFAGQRPGYRKSMAWWIVSAKREDTRLRRLDALIAESESGRVLDELNLPRVGAKNANG